MTPRRIPNSAIVKSTAKTILKGRWMEAVIASSLLLFSLLIMIFLCSLLPTVADQITLLAVNIFGLMFSLFVISPLVLGTVRYFWRLTDGAKDDISVVFYYFANKKKYLRAVSVSVAMFWRVVTVIFISMLPHTISVVLSETWLYQVLGQGIPIWTTNLILIRSFFYIVGIVCSALYLARYYLVPVIVVMDDQLLMLEAVHISSMVSKRSGSAFLALLTSMIGYIIISVLLIPTIYTLPLFLCCYVIHSRFAVVNYNLMLDYYENNSTTGTY